ncbi:hypothetical protein HD554DRAFT_2043269 [Boletus coccyginus]|nr:hypothetical protein HD554DRAFT_2043269 [Boletus coccyginus]
MRCLLELLGLLSYLAQTSRVHPNFLTPIQMSNTDPPHTNFDQVGLHHDASSKQPHGHQFEFSHTFHADMAPVTTPASEPPRSYYYSESSTHELHSPTVAPSVSRSTSRSVSTPVSIRNLDDKLRKCTLSHADKRNVELALDLIVLDAILNGTPWDSDNVEPTYLMQASAKTGHATLWNDNIRKLLINQIQTFRSKMAKTAETYATMYNLSSVVDPNGFLQPMEKSLTIHTRCEDILSPRNWQIYYLHDVDPQTESIPWDTTPLQLLSTSAAALACGLRRVWQPEDIAAAKSSKSQGKGARVASTLRYSADYNNLAQEIIGGMEKTLRHECPDIGRAFEQLLHKVHEDGLKLKASRAMPGNNFFIPSTSDIISLQLNVQAQSLGMSHQAIPSSSSQTSTAYLNPNWALTL